MPETTKQTKTRVELVGQFFDAQTAQIEALVELEEEFGYEGLAIPYVVLMHTFCSGMLPEELREIGQQIGQAALEQALDEIGGMA